jgi:NAD-dependent dihydropyrimidine dehydrogenase PreA subunit
MSQETFEGIPRNEIIWNPTIDYQKCTTCKKCVEFCKRGVFAYQENPKKAIVKNPTSCKVYCKNCQKQCPNAAITHPSEEETKKYIEQIQNKQNQPSAL